MDIAQELLKQSENIDMGALASQFGLSESQAGSAVTALLPAILGGVKKTEEGGGLEQLGSLGSMLGAPAEDTDGGNAILGQIFGSKDVSRTVAADASAKSGIDAETLKKMLPLLAMAVAGYMAYQGRQGGAAAPAQADAGGLGGGLGGILGSILGGGASTPAAPAATPAAGGLGGLGSMLDMDGDGNPLNDILGMAGKAMGR